MGSPRAHTVGLDSMQRNLHGRRTKGINVQRRHRFRLIAAPVALATMLSALAIGMASADGHLPMMEGKSGWSTEPIFTIGDSVNGYTPPGIPDGTGAWAAPSGGNVMLLVNHELDNDEGYVYELGNGTELSGARVSYFEVDPATGDVVDAGLAYDTVYDRHGDLVTTPEQINEAGDPVYGFDRFCSAQGYADGEFGFEDNIFFTGEETGNGSLWALDVDNQTIWAVPAAGRGAWENVTAVSTGRSDTIGLLLGDDVESAPLYLYIGYKDAKGDGSFLDRNGLAKGQLYAWRAFPGAARPVSPEDWNGTGESQGGGFVRIPVQRKWLAGTPGYDEQGYLDDVTMRAIADAKGAFSFSRPEDLATNPEDGTEAVFASTGRGGLFPSDNWGTTYTVDIRENLMPNDNWVRAKLHIVHDTDDYGDYGIRSPDNLEWAEDGYVYIQEDRSTSPSELFGGDSGREASIARLDVRSRAFTIIAEMDRDVVLPVGSTDGGAGDIGNWESSGVLDLSDLFGAAPGQTILLATVQAHGITDGIIASEGLVQGGQLILLTNDAAG
jgi:hypothetical protein